MRAGRLRADLASAALCIALFASTAAKASPSPMSVALEYSAVAGCPDAAYFKSVVLERLGVDAFGESAQTRVIVRVTTQGPTFEGSLEWLDEKGNWAGDRLFPGHSSDCEDLVRAMAFTLALQLQLAGANAPPSVIPTSPESKPIEGPPSTTPQPTVSNKPPIAEQPAQPRTPKLSRAARPAFAIGAGTFLGFGMSSSVLPFARVFGSAAWTHWSLELAAEANLPTIIRRADGAGFASHQLLASIAGCTILQPLSACLLAKAGQIRVAGKDVDVPASAAGPIVETGLRVGAMQRIYRGAYVSAYVEGVLLPLRWGVTLDHSVVWTSPHFAEAIGLDVALRFE